MRGAEPLEPEVVDALEAIDAALHDEPVDPELADLAELSLILRDERPEPDEAFARRLDRRVQLRFENPERRVRRASNRGLWASGAVAAVGALIAVVVLVGGRSGSSSSAGGGGVHLISRPSTASSTVSSAASSTGSTGSAGAAASSAGGGSTFGGAASSAARAATPHTPADRQVAQSAHLALTAGAGRIESVAQQVFDVIAAEHGFVASSHVQAQRTGTSTARFALRVPSGRLRHTLNRLSHLRHAHVLARSDASADVTGQVRTAADRLGQDRAYHRSLLRRLSAASTTGEADRIQARLRRNDAAILRDENALRGLHRRVTDSRVSVSIQAPPAVRRNHHHGGAGPFTLRRALHDAGRVLIVAAGVALIALAVLVPAGLLAAFAAWLWALARRRRREATLGP